jgi:hypothetical protein
LTGDAGGQGARNAGTMTQHQSAASVPAADAIRQPRGHQERIRADRLTVAGGISLLVVCSLHTVVFALHPWWGAWMAGPFRTEQLPTDAAVQFWGLPGGFVVPGLLLALLILDKGRRGNPAPVYVGAVIGVWAFACVWMVGPSGFMLLLVPAVLLFIASMRSRRR